MAKITLTRTGEPARPHWLPRSAFPFQLRLAASSRSFPARRPPG